MGFPGISRVSDCPLNPAEVGQEKNGIVGGDTGLPVPHASCIFDKKAKKKKNFLVWGVFLVALGDLKGSSGVAGVGDSSLDLAEVRQDRSLWGSRLG